MKQNMQLYIDQDKLTKTQFWYDKFEKDAS